MIPIQRSLNRMRSGNKLLILVKGVSIKSVTGVDIINYYLWSIYLNGVYRVFVDNTIHFSYKEVLY